MLYLFKAQAIYDNNQRKGNKIRKLENTLQLNTEVFHNTVYN